MRPVKSHVFMGKRYRIKEVSPSSIRCGKLKKNEQVFGLCSPPDKKGKTITIAKGQDEFDELDTFIHEANHAINWNNSEEFVTQSSNDLAKFLWRLGYRRVK